MKKKCKMIFKVNSNKTAKLYLNKKWHRDVTELDIHAEPFEYTIKIKQNKRNERGKFYVEDGEIASETNTYKL